MADTSGYAPDLDFSDPSFDSSMNDLTSDLGSDISSWSYSPGWLDNIWGAISSPTAKNLLNIGSGAYGLYEANQMKNISKDAMRASDPFGPERAKYAAQLSDLMKNPSSITSDPGYQFQFDQGAQAVERKMSAGGYLGSGNEGIALTEYGQNYAASALKEKLSLLSGLAGSGISPSFGASLSGYASGIDTASQSLASLGYAATKADPSTSTPSRPKAAGGEAAAIGSIVKGASGIVGSFGGKTAGSAVSSAGDVISGLSKGGVGGYAQAVQGGARLGQIATGGSTSTKVGANGPDASGIGYVTPTAGTGGINVDGAISDLGSAASIYTGVQEGGVGGYAKAVGGAANLAGYDVPYLGYVDAATKLAKGDTGGAGYSAMITAAGPIAAIGSAIADAFNKSGDKKSAGTQAVWDQFSKQMMANGAKYQASRNMQQLVLADGRILRADGRLRKASDALLAHDESGYAAAMSSWMDNAYRPGGELSLKDWTGGKDYSTPWKP